jgi:hypothetical protein
MNNMIAEPTVEAIATRGFSVCVSGGRGLPNQGLPEFQRNPNFFIR